MIAILKTFAFWFSFRLQSQADGTFSVNNYVVGKLGTIGIGIWQVVLIT